MTDINSSDLGAEARARIEEARGRGSEFIRDARADGEQMVHIAAAAAIGSDSDLPTWARNQADFLLLRATSRGAILYFDVLAYEHFAIATRVPEFEVRLAECANEATREFQCAPGSLNTRKRWWGLRERGRAMLLSTNSLRYNATLWEDIRAEFRALESPHICAVVRDGWWHIEGPPYEPSHERMVVSRYSSTACRAVVGLGFTECVSELGVHIWLDLLVAKATPHCIGQSITNLPVASAELCEQILADFQSHRQQQPSSKAPFADAPTRKRRREFLDNYSQSKKLETREHLARHLGVSLTALQGIVRSDRSRYGPETLSAFLKKIGMTAEEW
jgi:hypothetical protein